MFSFIEGNPSLFTDANYQLFLQAGFINQDQYNQLMKNK